LNVLSICFVAPEAFLLFSQRNSISRILLELNGSAAFPDVLLPIQNLRAIRAVDFDPLDNYVYWIDRSAKSIRRARDNSTNVGVC
jgi:low density lipoprotein receptor-related protein 5/6